MNTRWQARGFMRGKSLPANGSRWHRQWFDQGAPHGKPPPAGVFHQDDNGGSRASEWLLRELRHAHLDDRARGRGTAPVRRARRSVSRVAGAGRRNGACRQLRHSLPHLPLLRAPSRTLGRHLDLSKARQREDTRLCLGEDDCCRISVLPIHEVEGGRAGAVEQVQHHETLRKHSVLEGKKRLEHANCCNRQKKNRIGTETADPSASRGGGDYFSISSMAGAGPKV